MKKNLIILLSIIIPSIAFTQTTCINQFYRQHKKIENTVNFKVPGFLIKMGTGIASVFTKDEDLKMGLKLGAKVRNARILVMQEANSIDPSEVQALIKNVRKESFNDLIAIKDESTNVNIMIREKNDKIRNLLIIVNEEDSFVLLSMKTNIKLKYLSKFINNIIKRSKEEKAKRNKEKEVPRPEPIPTEEIRA